jgi:anti-sigma factor RsiW
LLQFRHRRFRRDLSAYLDNMLSERARLRLEAHLDSCQACRQELAELRSAVEALGSLPMAEVPRSFALAGAPVAEVRPRPAVRRLEFGLRLATATAAFALALVVIGDFAGLPGGGGEKEATPALLAPIGTETPAVVGAVPQATPEPTEAAPAETPLPTGAPVPREEAPPVTPAAVETPAVVEAPPVGTSLPGEGEAPAETPSAAETPVTPPSGYAEVQPPTPAVGAGAPEEGTPEKEATERAGIEEQAEAGAAYGPVAEQEGGGLSREEVVRWLEVGLGAGTGALVLVWAFVRFERRIGNRP